MRIWLEFQKQASQDFTGFTESENGIKQPIKQSTEYVIENKSELKAMQEAILEKEQRILASEKHIDRREMIIKSHYDSYYNEMDKLLFEKMTIDSKSGIEDKLNNKIKSLEKTNSDLNSENKKIKKEVFALLERIDENTQTNFLEKLLPYAGTLLSGITLSKIIKALQEDGLNSTQQQTPELNPSISDVEASIQPTERKIGDRGPIPPPPDPKKEK